MRKVAAKPKEPTSNEPIPASALQEKPTHQVVQIRGLEAVASAMVASTKSHEEAAARLEGLADAVRESARSGVSFEIEIVDRDSLGRMKKLRINPVAGG